MQKDLIYKNLSELAMATPIALIFLLWTFLLLAILLVVIRKNRQPSSTPKMQVQQSTVRSGDEKKLNPIFTSAIPLSPAMQQSSLGKRNLQELLEIEESLLAVRELYLRKLIPTDIYVAESLKYAA